MMSGIVKHAGNLNTAFAQLPGVDHELIPRILPRNRFALVPAEPFADDLRTGAPGRLGNRRVTILRMAHIPRIGARQPALGGIQREKGIRIAPSRRRVRHHRETAQTAELRSGSFQSKRIVTVGQCGKGQYAFALPRPFAGTQHPALPVGQNPLRRTGGSGFKAEIQRFPLREYGAGRRRNDRCRRIDFVFRRHDGRHAERRRQYPCSSHLISSH